MKQLPTDSELYRTGYRDRIGQLVLPAGYVAKDKIRTPKLPPNVLYAQYRQKSYDYVDTEEGLRERRVREYETITGIDQVVGSIRHELQKQKLDSNTVIVFASDHGIMSGEFGLGGKALNYESCLGIPMIVMDPRLPKSRRGRRLNPLVQSIDVAPTMLDLAGVRPPDTMQGRSMLPLLRGTQVKWRESVFAENLWSTVFGNPRVESVRTARWKYMRYFATDRALFGTAREGAQAYGVTPAQAVAYRSWLTASLRGLKPDYEELFDLEKDPHESNNLVFASKYRGMLAGLRQECDRLVREAKGDLDAAPGTTPLARSTPAVTAD